MYDLEPDIAVFAKGMSNGYPMAAIVGKAAVMQAAQDTFISSTYWTERIGPTAALATIRKHQSHAVAPHLIRMGEAVQSGWREAARRAGLPIEVSGIAPLSHFSICDESSGQTAPTLFTQLMLAEGFLADGAFYATYAHNEQHIDRYCSALETVFSTIAQGLQQATIGELLQGPVAHGGFQRLT